MKKYIQFLLVYLIISVIILGYFLPSIKYITTEEHEIKCEFVVILAEVLIREDPDFDWENDTIFQDAYWDTWDCDNYMNTDLVEIRLDLEEIKRMIQENHK